MEHTEELWTDLTELSSAGRPVQSRAGTESSPTLRTLVGTCFILELSPQSTALQQDFDVEGGRKYHFEALGIAQVFVGHYGGPSWVSWQCGLQKKKRREIRAHKGGRRALNSDVFVCLIVLLNSGSVSELNPSEKGQRKTLSVFPSPL